MRTGDTKKKIHKARLRYRSPSYFCICVLFSQFCSHLLLTLTLTILITKMAFEEASELDVDGHLRRTCAGMWGVGKQTRKHGTRT